MDLFSFVSILTSVVVFVCSVSEGGRLNDYILDYQPLTYDTVTVHNNHQRVRRSAETHLYVRFSAFGRNFHLKLSPSEGVFTPEHQVYIAGKGLHRADTSFIYQGVVKGEPKSAVHLAVQNGSLEGEVELPETTYHIEPAAKYIQDPPFHTIIYPETHLDTDPYRVRREAESASCGMHNHEVLDFMERESRLADDSKNTGSKRLCTLRVTKAYTMQETWAERDVSHNIYSEYSNRAKRYAHDSAPSRQKRALGATNACPLHMRADPLLFKYFKETKHGRTVVDAQAEEEILAFFSNHVNAMSSIYSRTVFQTYDGQMQNTGMSFVIHRSTIMKDCSKINQDYCTNSLDVSNYLDLTSQEDHNLYCLVFTFTYRDFSGGTLGLAWVATESNVQSGVCGRYSRYTGGKQKSLNTGIVTIINFGKTVPNRVSQLTFAHEAGHNFGSPHDIGSVQCAPYGTSSSDANNGNFIMFPSATSGNKPNNDKFSVCSRDNMTRIIQQVVNSVRYMCFVESGQAFCGNKITEGTEQCDCGFGICPTETCCEGRQENDPNSGCKRTPNSECSPDSGPCCQANCSLVPADGLKCEEDSACKVASYCNSFRCPEPSHKPNNTFCNDYSKVCVSGECIGPVCLNVVDSRGEWEECFQASDTGSDNELCFVACKNPSTGDCISSMNSDALAKTDNLPFKLMLETAAMNRSGGGSPSLSDLPITLPAGSACDNFRGYCDTFSKCQRIDAQGPFNQLTNMIFDPVTLNKVKDWIVEHWWAVLLMCVALVVFMGVFIKVFGYNTPSEDPKRKRTGQQQQNQRQGQGRGGQGQQQPSRGQGARPSAPPSYGNSPPPYSVEMEMDRYGKSQHGRHQQFDRLAPKNRI